jgi:transposase
VRDLSCGDTRIFLELEVRPLDCRHCGKVKREQLDFLADNPLYTKRFAYYVGRRCRSATIKDVAAELKLDWHTVKALDQQYMEGQLKRAGTPGPRVIGIDEIAIRKGHTYRIVVSDLLRGRPIWFGGKGRSEASMGEFYAWLVQKKSARADYQVSDALVSELTQLDPNAPVNPYRIGFNYAIFSQKLFSSLYPANTIFTEKG